MGNDADSEPEERDGMRDQTRIFRTRFLLSDRNHKTNLGARSGAGLPRKTVETLGRNCTLLAYFVAAKFQEAR